MSNDKKKTGCLRTLLKLVVAIFAICILVAIFLPKAKLDRSSEPASQSVTTATPSQQQAAAPKPEPQNPIFDFLSVEPSELPKTTKLTEAVIFSIADGKGSVTAAKGMQVVVLSRKDNMIEVSHLGGKQLIPYTKTTIEEEVTEYRKEKQKKAAEQLAIEEQNKKQQEAQEKLNQEQQKTDSKLAQDAYYAARRYIQNSLKAPSTAKFSNILTDTSTTGTSKESTGRFRSWGAVEAKNSFGVPLQEKWLAELQEEGSSWRVVYARLGDQVLVDTRTANKTTEIKSAEQFIGMSREKMIAQFGQPIQIKPGSNSSDGAFKIYVYSNDKGKETYFVIWDSDGTISDGMYKGTLFSK